MWAWAERKLEEEKKQEMGVVVGTYVACTRERTRDRAKFSQQGHWPHWFILLIEGWEGCIFESVMIIVVFFLSE